MTPAIESGRVISPSSTTMATWHPNSAGAAGMEDPSPPPYLYDSPYPSTGGNQGVANYPPSTSHHHHRAGYYPPPSSASTYGPPPPPHAYPPHGDPAARSPSGQLISEPYGRPPPPFSYPADPRYNSHQGPHRTTEGPPTPPPPPPPPPPHRNQQHQQQPPPHYYQQRSPTSATPPPPWHDPNHEHSGWHTANVGVNSGHYEGYGRRPPPPGHSAAGPPPSPLYPFQSSDGKDRSGSRPMSAPVNRPPLQPRRNTGAPSYYSDTPLSPFPKSSSSRVIVPSHSRSKDEDWDPPRDPADDADMEIHHDEGERSPRRRTRPIATKGSSSSMDEVDEDEADHKYRTSKREKTSSTRPLTSRYYRDPEDYQDDDCAMAMAMSTESTSSTSRDRMVKRSVAGDDGEGEDRDRKKKNLHLRHVAAGTYEDQHRPSSSNSNDNEDPLSMLAKVSSDMAHPHARQQASRQARPVAVPTPTSPLQRQPRASPTATPVMSNTSSKHQTQQLPSVLRSSSAAESDSSMSGSRGGSGMSLPKPITPTTGTYRTSHAPPSYEDTGGGRPHYPHVDSSASGGPSLPPPHSASSSSRSGYASFRESQSPYAPSIHGMQPPAGPPPYYHHQPPPPPREWEMPPSPAVVERNSFDSADSSAASGHSPRGDGRRYYYQGHPPTPYAHQPQRMGYPPEAGPSSEHNKGPPPPSPWQHSQQYYSSYRPPPRGSPVPPPRSPRSGPYPAPPNHLWSYEQSGPPPPSSAGPPPSSSGRYPPPPPGAPYGGPAHGSPPPPPPHYGGPPPPQPHYGMDESNMDRYGPPPLSPPRGPPANPYYPPQPPPPQIPPHGTGYRYPPPHVAAYPVEGSRLPPPHHGHPHAPHHHHPHHTHMGYPVGPYGYMHQPPLEEKVILRKKFSWKHYPELERFLIENRDEYLKHSSRNYTVEQKQFNNQLTDRLLELAERHNFVFDPNEFNFVAIRDRIRCYYKSYIQTARKRGVELPGSGSEGKGKRSSKSDGEEDDEDNDPDDEDEDENDDASGERDVMQEDVPSDGKKKGEGEKQRTAAFRSSTNHNTQEGEGGNRYNTQSSRSADGLGQTQDMPEDSESNKGTAAGRKVNRKGNFAAAAE